MLLCRPCSRHRDCEAHTLGTVCVIVFRPVSAPAPYRPALSSSPAGADRPGLTIACRAHRQPVPRQGRAQRGCSRRTCPRIRSRADPVHAPTHAYAFVAGYVALHAGSISRIGPGLVHANGRPMCRRQHTHRKPNRRRRRRQHPKRTRLGRPSTARSSHAPGRPAQSVDQCQARRQRSRHASEEFLCRPCSRDRNCEAHTLSTVCVTVCRPVSAPAPHCPALSIFPGGASQVQLLRAERPGRPSHTPKLGSPTRPAAASLSPANQSAVCTLAALDLAGGLAPGGPWARTCIQSRVGHVHANGRPMCRRQHTHRKLDRRRRRRPRSKPTRPGRPSTARSSHAPGRPTTPLSASTKQPFASPNAGPHPGDVTPSPGPPHLPFFISLRGGSAGRSLPASHAPQPYNSRYTECPRPTPQFNELNHAKVGRLHRCAFRIT